MELKPYTEDEVRERFLEHVRADIEYWSTVDLQDGYGDTIERRVSGVAFSILALLDGAAVDLPAFRVSPRPHPSDKEFHQSRGERWYSEDVDIAGVLHELLGYKKQD